MILDYYVPVLGDGGGTLALTNAVNAGRPGYLFGLQGARSDTMFHK